MEPNSRIYKDLMKDLYVLTEVSQVDMTSKEYKALETKDRAIKARELIFKHAKEVANNGVAGFDSAGIRTDSLAVWIRGYVEVHTEKENQIVICAKAKDLELGLESPFSILGTINYHDNDVTASSDYYWEGEVDIDDERAAVLIEILDSTMFELLAPNDRIEKILGRAAMQEKIKE